MCFKKLNRISTKDMVFSKSCPFALSGNYCRTCRFIAPELPEDSRLEYSRKLRDRDRQSFAEAAWTEQATLEKVLENIKVFGTFIILFTFGTEPEPVMPPPRIHCGSPAGFVRYAFTAWSSSSSEAYLRFL